MSYSSDEDWEEENLFLCETAFENGTAFVNSFEKYSGNVNTFLHRDDYIPVRCTSIDPYEQELCLTFKKDVDGVVIEWKNAVGIGMAVSHLQIVPRQPRPLKSVYGMLKKHLDLCSYSENARKSFKNSVGVQLFYTSEGWETWLGFIPTTDLNMEYSMGILEKASFRAINELKIALQEKLRALIGKGIAKDTLAKNNLLDLSRLRILPDDQHDVLKVFDEALKVMDLSILPCIRKILFTFRFGDKCTSLLKLPISKQSEVENISLHLGVNISASAPMEDSCLPIELFWSKEGIQEIVGKRGSLISAFSFSECGNYQSNLDGRMLRISPHLSSVCSYPDGINFVQLYVDLPHRYPNSRFHPVSAAILLVDGIIKKRNAVDEDARRYIQEMKNNFEQLVDATCRLEFVVKLPCVYEVVDAQTLINEEKLRDLLKGFPLLIPFCHENFVNCLRKIGHYLTDNLENSLRSSRGTGEGKAVWLTFQHELAVEKVLFGHPLCHSSRLYSINLGPGVDYPSRSKSDTNGFLSFEDSYCCCVDEFTHPPVSLYSKSEVVRSQMSKTFGVLDLIHGSKAVLGARLVWILLKDLYDVGNVYATFDAFHLSLKAENEEAGRMRITGGTTMETLVDMIAKAKKAKYPMVISCLLSILQLKGADISESLAAGMKHWKLGYFPALRLYDTQRNEGLYWNWSFGFWVLLDTEKCVDDANRMAKFITPLVVNNLENLKLCHASTLENKILPWVKPCIEKLKELALGNKDLITVLTFVTCIARLMDGHYVDFYNLDRLEKRLPKPVTQRYLQALQIQDKFLINKFNRFRLWRLHHSLPFKLSSGLCSKSAFSTAYEISLDKTVNATQVEEVDQLEPTINKRVHEDIEVIQESFGATERKHIPTNCLKHWTPCELSILADVKENHSDLSKKSMYEHYQNACRAMGIPDRSFYAFKVKINRYEKMDVQ